MTPHHHHENCVAIFEKLSEYLDNELDELTCRDIERHLNDCQCCHACMETLKRTVSLCREMAPEPVPASLSDRLRDLIHQLK